jgi:hypothetical protein
MITIFITGGLGNQIFQIACALGLSYKTNNKLIIGKNLITTNSHQNNNKELTVSILKKVFPELNIVDNLDISSYYHYKEKNAEAFNYTNIYNELTNIFNNSNSNNLETMNIVLKGYFITEKYFEIPLKCCIELTPKKNNYKEITNNFENTYFIHIRLGDYVNHFLYNIQLVNYYNDCINKIIVQDPLAKFIICTNEYNNHFTNYINKFPQTKNTNNNIINYIIQDKNNDAPDTLYIMKSCKGGICSNSTLSWLGAYFQQFKNDETNINNDKNYKNKLIFMPYPWVNFVNGFTHDNIKDVYPEWAQLYDTINNKIMFI